MAVCVPSSPGVILLGRGTSTPQLDLLSLVTEEMDVDVEDNTLILDDEEIDGEGLVWPKSWRSKSGVDQAEVEESSATLVVSPSAGADIPKEAMPSDAHDVCPEVLMSLDEEDLDGCPRIHGAYVDHEMDTKEPGQDPPTCMFLESKSNKLYPQSSTDLANSNPLSDDLVVIERPASRTDSPLADQLLLESKSNKVDPQSSTDLANSNSPSDELVVMERPVSRTDSPLDDRLPQELNCSQMSSFSAVDVMDSQGPPCKVRKIVARPTWSTSSSSSKASGLPFSAASSLRPKAFPGLRVPSLSEHKILTSTTNRPPSVPLKIKSVSKLPTIASFNGARPPHRPTSNVPPEAPPKPIGTTSQPPEPALAPAKPARPAVTSPRTIQQVASRLFSNNVLAGTQNVASPRKDRSPAEARRFRNFPPIALPPGVAGVDTERLTDRKKRSLRARVGGKIESTASTEADPTSEKCPKTLPVVVAKPAPIVDHRSRSPDPVTAAQLQQITGKHTARNRLHYNRLETVVVYCEGQRPPSPSSKIRRAPGKRENREQAKASREARAFKRQLERGDEDVMQEHEMSETVRDTETAGSVVREGVYNGVDPIEPQGHMGATKSVRWMRELVRLSPPERLAIPSRIAAHSAKPVLVGVGPLDRFGNVLNAKTPLSPLVARQDVRVTKMIYADDPVD